MNDVENLEIPKGKWINKLNGDTIEVRDTIIDGDNMLLQTNKGLIDVNEFARYYIQVSDDIYDMNGKVIDNKPVTSSDYNIVNNTVIQERPTYNTVIETTIPSVTNNEPKILSNENLSNENSSNISENSYEALVNKIFDKKPINPKVSLNLECDNLPIDELKMLVNVFDVPTIYISDYFMANFVDFNSIKEQVKTYIEDKIK